MTHTPTPPAGSALYYALQLVPSRKRETLRAWWHWWHEVSSIPFNIQDPGVAESKLLWWQQEVLAAFRGQATHPLTKALIVENQAPDKQLWLSQIDGLIELIHQTRWLDVAGLRQHQFKTTAAAAVGAAHLLGASSDAAKDAARQLGQGLRQVHQLARLGQDARAGWVHVPVDVLQQHDVRAHELTKPAPQASANWPHLLTCLCDQAQENLNAGLLAKRQLSGVEARALKPLTALSHMQLALLAEIRKSQDRVLHERLILTPVRKWWIAARVRVGLLR